MMKKFLLSLALLLAAPALLPAQEPAPQGTPFNGLAIDHNGKGIKVKVSVKNSDKHTTADGKGRFGLMDIAATDTLILRYKGHEEEVAVEGRLSLKVIWAEHISFSEDQELVDTGYGYIKRRDYTGSSNGFTGETIRQYGFNDLQTAILTLIPNVQLINGEIVIRGINSINLSSGALIICDNVPVNSLNQINIHDVKSVEVQKGSNMYGVRGANGVIVIRTR